MEVQAIIPARSSSKGIKNKNLIPFKNFPLIYWSIKHGLESKQINNTFISTDSQQYCDLATTYGAISLGLRSKDISGDHDKDFTFLLDHLDKVKVNSKFSIPNILVILRPTSPIRDVKEIDEAIKYMKQNFSKLDCIRSVNKSSENPYKMWVLNKDGYMQPLIGSFEEDYVNSPRQLLPISYYQNGLFDIINVNSLQKGTSSGTKVYPWFTAVKGIDIDTDSDIPGKYKN